MGRKSGAGGAQAGGLFGSTQPQAGGGLFGSQVASTASGGKLFFILIYIHIFKKNFLI